MRGVKAAYFENAGKPFVLDDGQIEPGIEREQPDRRDNAGVYCAKGNTDGLVVTLQHYLDLYYLNRSISETETESDPHDYAPSLRG